MHQARLRQLFRTTANRSSLHMVEELQGDQPGNLRTVRRVTQIYKSSKIETTLNLDPESGELSLHKSIDESSEDEQDIGPAPSEASDPMVLLVSNVSFIRIPAELVPRVTAPVTAQDTAQDTAQTGNLQLLRYRKEIYRSIRREITLSRDPETGELCWRHELVDESFGESSDDSSDESFEEDQSIDPAPSVPSTTIAVADPASIPAGPEADGLVPPTTVEHT